MLMRKNGSKSCVKCKHILDVDGSKCPNCGATLPASKCSPRSETRNVATSKLKVLAWRFLYAALGLCLVITCDHYTRPVEISACRDPAECLGHAEVEFKYGKQSDALVAIERMCSFRVEQACLGLSGLIAIGKFSKDAIGIDGYLKLAEEARARVEFLKTLLDGKKERLARNSLRYHLDPSENSEGSIRLLGLLGRFEEPHSLTVLAEYYIDGEPGIGIKKNRSKAIRYLEKAALHGWGPAFENLARIYLNQDDSNFDLGKGLALASRACLLNQSEACALLGKKYLEGARGLVPDHIKALPFLLRGAVLQNCQSAKDAGAAYLLKGGRDKKVLHAINLLGAASGEKECQTLAKEFRRSLTPKQMSEAVNLANKMIKESER